MDTALWFLGIVFKGLLSWGLWALSFLPIEAFYFFGFAAFVAWTFIPVIGTRKNALVVGLIVVGIGHASDIYGLGWGDREARSAKEIQSAYAKGHAEGLKNWKPEPPKLKPVKPEYRSSADEVRESIEKSAKPCVKTRRKTDMRAC